MDINWRIGKCSHLIKKACLAVICFRHHPIIHSPLGIYFLLAVILRFILCLYLWLKTGAQKCSLVNHRGIVHPSVLLVKKSHSILTHHEGFLLAHSVCLCYSLAV